MSDLGAVRRLGAPLNSQAGADTHGKIRATRTIPHVRNQGEQQQDCRCSVSWPRIALSGPECKKKRHGQFQQTADVDHSRIRPELIRDQFDGIAIRGPPSTDIVHPAEDEVDDHNFSDQMATDVKFV